MNKSNIPDWASKYCDLGFSPKWVENVLEKYSDDLINSLSDDLSPVKYVNVDFTNISDESLTKFPDPPNGYTFTEVVLVTFDVINSFSENIPSEDKKIYSMYQKINQNEKFSIESDFPEFYKFCRQIQYNSIDKLSQYKKLNKTYSNYIDTNKPKVGTDWLVEHKDEKYEVAVQAKSTDSNEDIVDPEFYCQVTKVITEGAEEFDIGEFVDLPPICFKKKID